MRIDRASVPKDLGVGRRQSAVAGCVVKVVGVVALAVAEGAFRQGWFRFPCGGILGGVG